MNRLHVAGTAAICAVALGVGLTIQVADEGARTSAEGDEGTPRFATVEVAQAVRLPASRAAAAIAQVEPWRLPQDEAVALEPCVPAPPDARPTRFGELTLEEVEEELAPRIAPLLAAGERVDIIPPTPPDPTARPFEHGPYRIIPGGFVGEVEPREVFPLPEDFGIQTDDLAVLRASELWAEPGWLPDGFVLTEANTADSYSNGFILTIYQRRATGETIQIGRKRILELPINVPILLSSGSGDDVEFLQLPRGRFEVHLIDGQVDVNGYSHLSFYEPAARIETSVESADAPSLGPDDVVRIAESVRSIPAGRPCPG